MGLESNLVNFARGNWSLNQFHSYAQRRNLHDNGFCNINYIAPHFAHSILAFYACSRMIEYRSSERYLGG
jgi:hypothetical protein